MLFDDDEKIFRTMTEGVGNRARARERQINNGGWTDRLARRHFEVALGMGDETTSTSPPVSKGPRTSRHHRRIGTSPFTCVVCGPVPSTLLQKEGDASNGREKPNAITMRWNMINE
ncbi:hypothetical protein FRB91_009429 [Serendipita sp. 411]|nr:hypothetical protein FRC19_003446 [Serendipita sp. 401]KAG8850012.1 hypothetical protein FRB91_009429 [Serendipita sp. 411]